MDSSPDAHLPQGSPTRPSTATAARTGGNSKDADDAVAVRVAVHIRPLVENELAKGCQEILDVTPGAPQVSACQRALCGVRVCNPTPAIHSLASSLCRQRSQPAACSAHTPSSLLCCPCCRLLSDRTGSRTTMCTAVGAATGPPTCTPTACSRWWMACSRATMPPSLHMVRVAGWRCCCCCHKSCRKAEVGGAQGACAAAEFVCAVGWWCSN